MKNDHNKKRRTILICISLIAILLGSIGLNIFLFRKINNLKPVELTYRVGDFSITAPGEIFASYDTQIRIPNNQVVREPVNVYFRPIIPECETFSQTSKASLHNLSLKKKFNAPHSDTVEITSWNIDSLFYPDAATEKKYFWIKKNLEMLSEYEDKHKLYDTVFSERYDPYRWGAASIPNINPWSFQYCDSGGPEYPVFIKKFTVPGYDKVIYARGFATQEYPPLLIQVLFVNKGTHWLEYFEYDFSQESEMEKFFTYDSRLLKEIDVANEIQNFLQSNEVDQSAVQEWVNETLGYIHYPAI